mmetsp:Transcript_20594/g.58698  ORF Transcript_20594/g.58698 Transcript_20594/m.58698 type:complete len:439 (+) Transcript_20594:1447-2763(+)
MLPLPFPLPFVRTGGETERSGDFEHALSGFFFLSFFEPSRLTSGLPDLDLERERKRASNFRSWSSTFSFSSRHSSVISSRMRLILSGLPTRTAFTPSARRPIAMLSTATLLSDVASRGDKSSTFDHIFMICTDTCVLPVPGGPWMMVQVCLKAERTASLCDWLRCVKVLTSANARSNFSSSVPPGFNFASLAAALSTVSLSANLAASSAARAAARLSSSVGPPWRHCLDQLSANPTFAVMSSSDTRGRALVTRLSMACNCRSYKVLLAPLSMRHLLDIASSGQQPRSRITICASSRPFVGRKSAMKPSPMFSSRSPRRTCCRDSAMVTESPRLNFKRSKFVFGGNTNAPISLPGSSHPIIVCFFGSRRPNTPLHGRPSRVQPNRCNSPSGRRCVLRLICRSSSMCSRCISMQKWPKYSAAACELSCVTKRAFKALGFS